MATHDPTTGVQADGRQPWSCLWKWVVGLLAACVVGLLLHQWDTSLMRTRYELIPGEVPAQQWVSGVREFGQPVCVVVLLIALGTYAQRGRRIVGVILLAELIAWVGYQPAKMLVARYRPFALVEVRAGLRADPVETPRSSLGLWPRVPGGEGTISLPDPRTKGEGTPTADEILADLKPADTWLGWRPGNASLITQSFPSGHAAGAFALAIVLGCVYPRLAWMFWTLAVGCTLSRYVDAMHWPSDCWVGAVIGYTAAKLALRVGGKPFIPPVSG